MKTDWFHPRVVGIFLVVASAGAGACNRFATLPPLSTQGIAIQSDLALRLNGDERTHRFRINHYQTNLVARDAVEREDAAYLIQFDLTRRIAYAAAAPVSQDPRLISHGLTFEETAAALLLTGMPEILPRISADAEGIAVSAYSVSVDIRRLDRLMRMRSQRWRNALVNDFRQAIIAWETMAGFYQDGRKIAVSPETENRFIAAKTHLRHWFELMRALDANDTGSPATWPTEETLVGFTSGAVLRLAAFYAADDHHGADRFFHTLCRTIPDLPDPYFVAAGHCLKTGDAAEAALRLETALAIDPEFAAAHALMARVQDRLGNTVLADHHRTMARQLAPERYSIDSQRLSVDSDPASPRSLSPAQAAVLTLIQQGRLAAAHGQIEAMLNKSPSDWRNYLLLGWMRSEQSHHAQAIAAFVQGYRLDAQRIFLYNIGLNAAWLKDYSGCITYLRRYLNETDASAATLVAAESQLRFRAMHFIGAAQMNLGHYDEAVSWCRKALQLHDSYLVWRNLGLSLKQMGRVDEARRALYQSMALQPTRMAEQALSELNAQP